MPFQRMTYQMEGAEPPGSPAPAPSAPPAPAPAGPPSPAPAPAAALPPDVAQRELAEARKEAAAYRERLRKAEAEAEERTKAALVEQGKFKELYEAEQKATASLKGQLSSYEAAFHAQVEAEIASVPEHFRDLIPPGNDTQRMEWVRNAKSRGLFGASPAPAAPPAPAPAVAPTAPAAAPPTASPAKPPKPTDAEMQQYGYTRDSTVKATIGAKIRAWQAWSAAHPGES
jgi:2-oxoglutarate dehydrogenase E2 component (dihydrolipoamide succinyltransferase)